MKVLQRPFSFMKRDKNREIWVRYKCCAYLNLKKIGHISNLRVSVEIKLGQYLKMVSEHPTRRFSLLIVASNTMSFFLLLY